MTIQPHDDTGSQEDKSSTSSSTRKCDIIRIFLGISKPDSKVKNKKSTQSLNAEPLQHTSGSSSISSKTTISPSNSRSPGSSSASGDKNLPLLPSEDYLPMDIFPKNLPRPFFKTGLPASPDRIETTQQLAYCNGLIIKGQLTSRHVADETSVGTLTNDPQGIDVQEHQSSVSTINGPQKLTVDGLQECEFNESEQIWMKEMEQVPVHQDYLQWMANRVVEEFSQDFLKDTDAIAEVVLLGTVLDRETYRTLLTCVVIKFDESRILDIVILQGLVKLIEGASFGYLREKDLVKTLVVLRRHLGRSDMLTHEHLFQTTLATSRLLDVVVNSLPRYPSLAHEQQSLSRILDGLKDTTNLIMKFQVEYAVQALQYIQDDESAFQTLSRFSGGVVKAALGTVDDWKLEPSSLIKCLDVVRQVAGESYEVMQAIMEHTVTYQDNRLRALQSLVEGFHAGARHEWYLTLLAARMFAQDGRLVDFNELVCRAPCRDKNPFQLGVCQILGDIAADPLWDDGTRVQAIEFLKALLKSYVGWKPHADVKQWIFITLTQLAEVSGESVKDHALATLRELDWEYSAVSTSPTYSLWKHLPLPEFSPLLTRAQKIPYAEYDISQLKLRRLEEGLLPVYIPPMAKANLRAHDNELFPLLEKVKEFLGSERQVLLILGDSGAGKSTFSKRLELNLWHSYISGGRIPLFVNLPALDRPDRELITEQLRIYNFSEAQIYELRETREFVVICDGYDETQLTSNLHTMNLFNRPGQWRVKVVISCRTQYLGHDYRDRFQPQENTHYGRTTSDLFQEAVIAPFSQGQIESYVEQYVPLEPRTWTTEEYMYKLSIIPHLMDLVGNPFLLSLCLEALPEVTQATEDLASLRITRLKLYDIFADHWFTINKRRLQNSSLSNPDREILGQLVDANFASKGIDYCTRLASAIFEQQDGNPVVQYIHMDDKESWKADFFGPQPNARLLRDSSPLTRSGTRYRFLHRSMLEYFFTRAIHGPSNSAVSIAPNNPASPVIPVIPIIPVIPDNLDHPDISNISDIQGVDTQETVPDLGSETPVAQVVEANGSLSQKNILTEPSIIQFLCERSNLKGVVGLGMVNRRLLEQRGRIKDRSLTGNRWMKYDLL
ncbi:hypothetical protein BGZ96_009492 [Linnemannia gamsii]|uniref:NACHT domain-containing protein n=1 Tax=Linnemannia gamsii TaxID=64522 RepID=A0ABQ7JY11_9FUNG|nr:hypothetical protein BGZ96_009492 [Linnemannia gamsii]